jgi:putative nucleotidyltransferase with HDIG domain
MMLKIVPTKQVRLGMFIHELQGPWLEHPFWKSAFILNDLSDLKKLQASAVSAVVIDTSKGLDVDGVEVPTETTTSSIIKTKAKLSFARLERERARQVIAKSKLTVTTMFDEVRMGKAVCAATALQVVDDIAVALAHNAGALISLVRLKHKDDYTYMHSLAVCVLMQVLAKQIGLPNDKIRQVGLAGLLHDIGKTGIDKEVLNKPGALTEGELTLVKLHPERGHALLLEANITDEVVLEVCLHHHEKTNGLGYPHQLKADDISVFAKMGAVCDVYDAITSDRPYKKGWQPGFALQQMAQWEGHFDDRVFRAFVKSVGIYPVSSVVALSSGRVAVVVEQSAQSLLKPVVKVFFSTLSNSSLPVQVVHLATESDAIVGHVQPEDYPMHDIEQIISQ